MQADGAGPWERQRRAGDARGAGPGWAGLAAAQTATGGPGVDQVEAAAETRRWGRASRTVVVAHGGQARAAAGSEDLAAQVRWTSQEDGDGAGYDIASFTPEGRPRLVEVKTTNGWERSAFHISRNELAVANDNRETWRLVRVWNFAREPRAFELAPPRDAHVRRAPTRFLARFGQRLVRPPPDLAL